MKLFEIIVIPILLILMGTFVFGTWYLSREIIYNMSYKSMVKQTVKEMVKKECLHEQEIRQR